LTKFVVKYVFAGRYTDLDDDLKDFARLKAHLSDVDLSEDPELILFNVDGTRSYYVVFLEEVDGVEDVERMIERDLGAVLSSDSKRAVKRVLDASK